MMKRAVSVPVLFLAALAAASGDAAPADSSSPSEAAPCITQHVMRLHDRTLKYTATAGLLPINDPQGKTKAHMFFVAYQLDGQKDLAERPVAFAFNGGPGASSLWLHIGGLGPKCTPLPEEGTALPSTDRLVDNENTWLDFTDLVFIDPVGTGYSRAAPGTDAKQFYDVDQDVEAAASFIRLYLTRYNRWLSPKYLVGESYGTTRAAGLARFLQSDDGINLRGVVLLSSALDFQTFGFGRSNDLSLALALPAYTAAAWYHHRLVPRLQADLKKTLAEVENWMIADYLPALARGRELPEPARSKIASRLAEFTGLTPQYIEQSDLRISRSRFAKQLLRDRQQKLGVLDSRVLGADLTPWSDYEPGDPAMALVTGPLVATINAYLRNDLHYRTETPYDFLSRSANHAWKWGSAAEGFLNVAPKLNEALTANPQLRLFMGAGCFDLTTPYFSQLYTLNHLGLNRALWPHTVWRLYRSGHQIYSSPSAAKELKTDATAFFQASSH